MASGSEEAFAKTTREFLDSIDTVILPQGSCPDVDEWVDLFVNFYRRAFDKNLYTAIYKQAIRSSNLKIAEHARKNGADVHSSTLIRDMFERYTLGDKESARKAITTILDHCDAHGYEKTFSVSAFFYICTYAINTGDIAFLTTLMSYCPRKVLLDKDHLYLMLSNACNNNYAECVALLLEYGALDPNKKEELCASIRGPSRIKDMIDGHKSVDIPAATRQKLSEDE